MPARRVPASGMNDSIVNRRSLSAAAVRQALRAVPGFQWLAECFCETQGSWLLRRPACDWLGDRTLARQLPPGFQLLARYCSAQRNDPVGAELLLRLIIWLRRLAGAETSARLEVCGLPIFLDLSDPRFLAVPRELASGLPRILKLFLGPGDTFVDVGSNHGSFAVTAARLVGKAGRVISVEPQARLAALVKRSLELYNASFVVHNVACGDSTGTARLYVPRTTSGAGGLFPAYAAVARHRTETVPLVRLDDLLQPERFPGRVVMKIDVEGSETRCLAGARAFLAAAKPVIVTEINSTALKAAGSSPALLAATLLESGYDRYLSGDGDLHQCHTITAAISDSNIIALHRDYVLAPGPR